MTSLAAESNSDGYDSCDYPWRRAFIQSLPGLWKTLVASIGRLWQSPFQKYVVLSYVPERAVWPLVSALKRKEATSVVCCNYKELLSPDRLHNVSDLTFSKRLHYGDFFLLLVYLSTHYTHSIEFVHSTNSSIYSSIHSSIVPFTFLRTHLPTYTPTHSSIHQLIDPKQVGRVQSATQKMNHTLPWISSLMLLRYLDLRERSFHPQLTSVQFVWLNSLYPGGYYAYHRV